MDRQSIKDMSAALKAYSKTQSLLPLSKEDLSRLPKEVIIACASEEIALVWERLPKYLKEDTEMQKYQFCLEHHNSSSVENQDVIDGPPPRKLYCCYCNINDNEFKSENSISASVEKFTSCCELL